MADQKTGDREGNPAGQGEPDAKSSEARDRSEADAKARGTKAPKISEEEQRALRGEHYPVNRQNDDEPAKPEEDD